MKPSPDEFAHGPTPLPVNGHRLSRRQAQVAGLVAQGLTDKEIAARLGLSEGTVGSYLKAVFLRLRVKSRAALVSVILAAAPAALAGPHGYPRTWVLRVLARMHNHARVLPREMTSPQRREYHTDTH
jgi:DNA-binding CsgD family transcriptional regulator